MTEAFSQTIRQIEASKQEPKQYLLPLLTPSRETLYSSSPPLHPLTKGKLPQERIAFQTSSKYGTTNWIESSHVFPSAYPRFEAAGQLPSISNQDVAMKLAKDLASRNQSQRWSLAQRIVPLRPCTEGNMHTIPEGRGLTIVITQIAKFNKKEWEQVVDEMIVELENDNERQHIEEIWFLIGDLLGEERSYEDNIRDVEQFIHSYLPVPSTKEEMKRYGPHWPAHTLKKQRGNSGRKGRVLIGVGHVCSAKLKLFDNMFATYVPNGRQGKTIAGQPYNFADAGWKDNLPKKLHLLPLLQPPKDAFNALYAPIHLWPEDWQPKATVAFNAKDDLGEKFSQQYWMATKHVFPAAYPRSHPQSVSVLGNQFEPKINFNLNLTSAELKQKRKDDIKKGISMIKNIDLKPFVPVANEKEAKERAKMLAQSVQPQLWGCVERLASFRERPKGKPITLIMAHATGFHKEIFRPSVQSLIKSFETKDGLYIDEIWSLDNFRTGDAGVLNAPFVGPAISSHDIARDIQQFIQYYLPVRSVSTTKDNFDHYPLHLKRQECGQAKQSRTIIAIGHSQGGACLLMAINATAKPNQPKTQLVDGFISFDAAFPLRESLLLQPLPHNEYMVAMTLARKDVFKDQNDLMDYLNKVPMFQSFDDSVKKLYAKYAFKEINFYADQEGQKTKKTFLIPKMSKWAEALSFCQLWLNCWTSTEVELGNYRGWTHFMVTTFIRDYPNKYVAELYTFCEKVAKANAPLIAFEYVKKGHLYPLEDPDGFGRDVAKVLHGKLFGSDKDQVTKVTMAETMIDFVRSRL